MRQAEPYGTAENGQAFMHRTHRQADTVTDRDRHTDRQREKDTLSQADK